MITLLMRKAPFKQLYPEDGFGEGVGPARVHTRVPQTPVLHAPKLLFTVTSPTKKTPAQLGTASLSSSRRGGAAPQALQRP